MQNTNIPVFFEGQDDLVDILATSICSICYNTKSFIDFYILDCGISAFNKKQLETLKARFNNFSIKYLPIDLKQFKGLRGWGAKGQFVDCYARLLIPEVAPEIDRAIYLDTDVIALGDIKMLWDEDMGGYEMAATSDIGATQKIIKKCVENLGVSKDHIFANAGVVLIDCKKWRKNQSSAKMLEIAKKYKEHISTIIEDIFCIYYNNNNYKLLKNRYNLPDRKNVIKNTFPNISDEYIEEEWRHEIIQHFSPVKVWKRIENDYNGRKLRNFDSFWFFAEMTPFYAGMTKTFSISNQPKETNYEYYKLFEFIPFLTVIKKNNKKKYNLFGFIPLLTLRTK